MFLLSVSIIILPQVPLYLNGLRNDVVLALKIPYIQSSAPDELEKAVGLSNYSKTIKVRLLYLVIPAGC